MIIMLLIHNWMRLSILKIIISIQLLLNRCGVMVHLNNNKEPLRNYCLNYSNQVFALTKPRTPIQFFFCVLLESPLRGLIQILTIHTKEC